MSAEGKKELSLKYTYIFCIYNLQTAAQLFFSLRQLFQNI